MRPEIVAVHFCRFGHSQKADPRRCVMSIAYQLSTQLPEFEARLTSLRLQDILEGANARTLFDRLIVQPLSDNFPDPGRIVVVLIDALDEATQDGTNQLALFLAAEFSKTPVWLRLIITSRPDPEVMYPLQGLAAHALDAATPDNAQDISTFLRRELKSHLLDVRNSDAVIEKIIELSEGNSLYVEWLRKEILSGRMALGDIDKFPQGLGAIYSQFVDRQWPDVGVYKKNIAPALDVIAAAHSPVPITLLKKIFQWSQRQQYEFQHSLGSLFVATDGNFFSFHKSLLDWLTDPNTAGPYFIDSEQGHVLLADAGWQQYQKIVEAAGEATQMPSPDFDGGDLNEYVPLHLAKAGRFEQVARYLSDP